VLPRDAFVGVSQYLFYFGFSGSGDSLRLESIENRVVDHQVVGRIAGVQTAQLPDGLKRMSERRDGALRQLVVLVPVQDISDPFGGFHRADFHVDPDRSEIGFDYIK